MSDPVIPERCAACDACARHAYSDATTPGFFYDKCEYHRLKAAEAKVAEQAATIKQMTEALEHLLSIEANYGIILYIKRALNRKEQK